VSTVTLTVDGKSLQAEKGVRLLPVLLEAGFDIPNLCFLPGMEPPHGGCRLCWVEVEGKDKPVTSCTVQVQDGMQVTTRSEAVDRLVRAGFEMLLSTHRLDCKDCPGNRRCALQDIAKSRKVPLKGKRLKKIEPDLPVDESRPEMGFNPNHCILCEKCVRVCNHEVKKGILDVVQRGLLARVSTFDGQPLARQDCGDCTRCAEVCPVGAIYLTK
jgi:formate dehydrogenase major subunit/NADH-quinone oxidoreductase subunit G